MISKLSTALSVALCTMLFVAAGSSEVAAQRGGPSGMMGNSAMSLLNDAKVAEELELDEEQVDALDELQGDMRNVFRDTFGGMRERFRDPNVDRDELMAEIRETIKTKMKTVDEKLEGVLMPHQMSRLSELTYQMEVKRGGTQGLLNNSKVKEKLGLTDEQIEKVKEKAEEVKKKLEETILQARADAQDEILSVLSSDQQAKIKEMIGESFTFGERRGWSGGGRDRGGRGGRDGGARGGRDGGGGGGRRGGGGGRSPQRPGSAGDSE